MQDVDLVACLFVNGCDGFNLRMQSRMSRMLQSELIEALSFTCHMPVYLQGGEGGGPVGPCLLEAWPRAVWPTHPHLVKFLPPYAT